MDHLDLGLAVDDLGQGEPAFLLLTGWCSTRGRWAPAAPLLAQHRRVVSFDWRGHGDSEPAAGDFGIDEMVQDALTVIAATGAEAVIPCAASHAGWVAIELRRRLGDRVPAIVHVDWMVTQPPPSYRMLIEELQSPEQWADARERLFEQWRAGDDSPEVGQAIGLMRRHDAEMWMRSGRAIARSYGRHGSPLAALAALERPPTVLHLYGQPRAPEYLQAQRGFAGAHPWFSVRQTTGRTHFSMIETPTEVAAAIAALCARLDQTECRPSPPSVSERGS